jgi:hypothetical protein
MEKEPGPKSDFVFDRKLEKMYNWLKKNMAAKGFDQAWVNDVLTHGRQEWKAIYTKWLPKETRTHEITLEKNAVRRVVEAIYRTGVWMIRACATITDDDRAVMEISPNNPSFHPVLPAPTSSLEATYDLTHVGRVTGHLIDDVTKSKAMLHNAGSIQIERVMQETEPVTDAEWTESQTIYKTSYVKDYPVECQRKTVYERYRWVSPTGQPGPWSRAFRYQIPG